MNNLKPILIGLAIGIFVLIGIEVLFGLNFVGKVKDNYQDDVESVVNILEQSDEAVFQLDYIISGLLLSHDFQEYLGEGIEKGWWTEEFLNQQLLDNLLPIYGRQFGAVFDAIKQSPTGQKIIKLIQKIKPIIQNLIQKLDKDQINALLAKLRALRDRLLSLDTSQIKALINKIKNTIYKIQAMLPQIKNTINNIKGAVNDVEDLINKIKSLLNSDKVNSIKDLINAYKNGTLDDAIKDKIKNSDLGKKISAIINNINSITWDEVKRFILDAISSSSLGDAIDEIISKIEDTVDDIQGLIDNLLQDVESDFDFYTVADANGNVVLPDGTTISARLLNALDIEITGVTYSNSSTPLNMNDDTLVIDQIAIGFESVGDKIYIATGNKQITGSSCITVKAIIPIVNSTI